MTTAETVGIVAEFTTGYQYFDDDMKIDQDFSPASIFVLNQYGEGFKPIKT